MKAYNVQLTIITEDCSDEEFAELMTGKEGVSDSVFMRIFGARGQECPLIDSIAVESYLPIEEDSNEN